MILFFNQIGDRESHELWLLSFFDSESDLVYTPNRDAHGSCFTNNDFGWVG